MSKVTEAKRNALILQLQKLREMTEANGCTEHEALSASSKAQELMSLYGVTMEDIKAATVTDDLCEQDEFSDPSPTSANSLAPEGRGLG